jgi:hypothetical protein
MMNKEGYGIKEEMPHGYPTHTLVDDNDVFE